MKNFRLILIIFFYLLLSGCEQTKINNSKKINIDFENRYKNIGFALIYDDNLEDIKKLAAFYKCFDFCGQLSDPVHHPKFIEILAYLRSVNVKCYVHNASSAKSLDWYIKAWKANTSATWIFGIDGLPNESHKYRVNQDGEKLFKIMCESKKYLNTRSVWQYIIFNYNEDHLEEAKKMADEHDLFFIQKQSSRWLSHDDPYMPSKKYKLGWRHG